MTQDTDYLYGLLTEGRLDLMHLPAGAVAWLWQYHRPQGQIDAAARFGAVANEMDDPVVDGALLRADKNVLVLHTRSGLRVSFYPDGGMGTNGEVIDPEMLNSMFMSNDIDAENGSVVALPANLSDPMDDAPGPPML